MAKSARRDDESIEPEKQSADQSGSAAEPLSIEDLNAAFSQMLGEDSWGFQTGDENSSDRPTMLVEEPLILGVTEAEDDACPITPRSILEAMLFVGNPDGQPLATKQLAAFMRGVEPSEIDELVCQLNDEYASNFAPYEIRSEGSGYRLTLRPEFAPVREKFYGRMRQARLSPAAIEVLAVVAYNEPLTADDVSRLRGVPSGHILSQLVRRQLLRIDRSAETPRVVRYHTTERFLQLFGLKRLDDLPRGQDLDKQ